jgi:hypothetical protein
MKKELHVRPYRPTFLHELSDGDMDSSDSNQFMVAYWSVYGVFSATLYMSQVSLISYDLEISRVECNIDVTPGTLTATDTCIGYHVTRFKASRKVILHTRYVCACVEAGGGRGRGTKIKTNVILHTLYVSTCVGAVGGRCRGTKIKTKANRCGACYYSITYCCYAYHFYAYRLYFINV